MRQWSGFGIERIVLIFTAVLYAGTWIQVSLFHRAGGFKKMAMYGPVFVTPFIVAAAITGAVRRDGAWGWIVAAMFSIGVLDGLIGLYYHLRGVAYQVGGFSMRNLLTGPPPVLPIAYSLIGLLGLVGILWDG